jgi:hypothetical protein
MLAGLKRSAGQRPNTKLTDASSGRLLSPPRTANTPGFLIETTITTKLGRAQSRSKIL